MKVLITGGTGLIGKALTRSLLADGHQVWVLSRKPRNAYLLKAVQVIAWDGQTAKGWGYLVDEMDAIVNFAGKTLASWPWTGKTKQIFWESRTHAGRAVVEALLNANHRPQVVIQASGINYYGVRGEDGIATEETPAADDFLAKLSIAWEDSTKPVEDMGVRRAIIRSAVVLAGDDGLLPLMALPIRLFLGGRLGNGRQALPWIHIADEIGAIRFLLENEQASGPFNLIAPEPTSNAEFMREVATALHRPHWFPTPAFFLRLVLGEMSTLVVNGRFSAPKRLQEAGFHFRFPLLHEALADIYN